MSGSITWRTYTDDLGVSYSFRQDKGSASAVIGNNSGDNVIISLPRTANLPPLPRTLEPRYIIIYPFPNSVSNPVKRKLLAKKGKKVIVGNPSFYNLLSEPETLAVITQIQIPLDYQFYLIGYVSGERRTLTPRIDDYRYS